MERRFPVKEPAAATPYPRDGTARIAWRRIGLILNSNPSKSTGRNISAQKGPVVRMKDQSIRKVTSTGEVN
jgi:hypothetical protein